MRDRLHLLIPRTQDAIRRNGIRIFFQLPASRAVEMQMGGAASTGRVRFTLPELDCELHHEVSGKKRWKNSSPCNGRIIANMRMPLKNSSRSATHHRPRVTRRRLRPGPVFVVSFSIRKKSSLAINQTHAITDALQHRDIYLPEDVANVSGAEFLTADGADGRG